MTAPGKMSPSISACLIVKNEAENLRPCLASLEDLACEIIVVDTGSTDNTVEVASSLGAKVYHFPWIDDFAAARNESLRHATSDWIFWLDADDRLSSKAVAGLKQAASSGKADAYACSIHSESEDDTHDVVQHVRLFRNHCEIWFSGAIHENVAEALVAHGLTLAETDVEIEHVGYHSPEAKQRKSARNLFILDRELRGDPSNFDLIFYRARELAVLGRIDESLEGLKRFLEGSNPRTVSPYKRVSAHALLVRLIAKQNRLSELDGYLDAALREFPDHPSFLLSRARLRLALGQPEIALPILSALLNRSATSTPGALVSRSWIELSLGECYRAMGRLSEAIEWTEAARNRAPRWEQAGLLLAHLYREIGRNGESLALLERMAPTAQNPKTWLILAELLAQAGRWEDASGAIDGARLWGLPAEQASELASRLKTANVPAATGHGKQHSDTVEREVFQMKTGIPRRTGTGKSREASRRGEPDPRQPVTLAHPTSASKPTAPDSRPSISACLIVKNEAENLRPCLASLEDLASEIIVVDTGSTDNTVEVARSLGAKVYHFPWIGDFAAARNESLKHATSEWIFWLDADDRLSSKAVAGLKQAASSSQADAYLCLVCSQSADRGHDVVEHVRLFKNGIGVRFEGAIHEHVVCDRPGYVLRTHQTGIEIEHTGYESPEAMRRKCVRNLDLLNRQLALQPDDHNLYFYRGNARGGLDDVEGALADMNEFLSRTRAGKARPWYRAWAYTVMVNAQERLGRIQEMEATLDRAIAEFPRHPYFLGVRGRRKIATGRPEEALPLLLKSVDGLAGPVVGFRPTEPWVHASLAECYRALGRIPEAIEWAERARAGAPEWEQAGLLLAHLYFQSGRPRELAELLEKMLPTARDPKAWLLLAELLVQQKRWEEAAGALDEARARGLPADQAEGLVARLKATRVLASTRTVVQGQGSPLKVRGLELLSANEHAKAVECFTEAIKATPKDPDNYKYLAVALKKLGREQEALEAWQLAETTARSRAEVAAG